MTQSVRYLGKGIRLFARRLAGYGICHLGEFTTVQGLAALFGFTVTDGL